MLRKREASHTRRPHLIALLHVYVAIGIVVHLLVDAADSFEAELLIFIVAQGQVDATELCGGKGEGYKHPRRVQEMLNT